MTNRPDMGNKIREYLSRLQPLTVLSLKELYQNLVVVPSDEPQVRYQLYRHAVGTPVFDSRPPQTIYAIRLENVPLPDGTTWDGFLSLPGIDRNVLLEDNDETLVGQLIDRLKAQYGEATIDYWAKAAQRRSVDLIRGAMETAKARTNGRCALCCSIGGLDAHVPKQTIRACHIISRKIIFWKTVCEVASTANIFSDEGVCQLESKLKENPLHSDARFMIGLCHEHDQLVQKTLRAAVINLNHPS